MASSRILHPHTHTDTDLAQSELGCVLSDLLQQCISVKVQRDLGSAGGSGRNHEV